MKLLLVNPPNTMSETFKSAKVFINKAVPFGLLHLYTYLRAQGRDIEFIDCFNFGISEEQLQQKILQEKPAVVAMTCLTAFGELVFRLGRWIKKNCPDCWVILGNVHASVYDNFYLQQGAADIVVHGEGEQVLDELFEAREGKRPLAGISGISYWGDGILHRNEPRSKMIDIDRLPSVYIDDIDFSTYQPVPGRSQFMVLASRGCIYGCNFCVVHCKKTHRRRKPETIMRELRYIDQRYNSRHFSFIDALFTGSRKELIELCTLMEKDLPGARWSCEAHFNSVDEELLLIMRRAGCYRISFGVESGNQAILKAMGKKTTVSRISKTVELAKRTGFQVDGCFMLGYIGETAATMNDTINLAFNLPFDEVQFSIFCPYPGSRDFERLVSQGLIPRNDNQVEATLNSWKRYNSYPIFTNVEPIYVPKGLTARQIRNLQRKAFRKLYFRPKMVWHWLKYIFTGQSRLDFLFGAFKSTLNLLKVN